LVTETKNKIKLILFLFMPFVYLAVIWHFLNPVGFWQSFGLFLVSIALYLLFCVLQAIVISIIGELR
jgi:hypothetical protein